MNLVVEISKHIMAMEGFRPGLPAWRNNNPGNLDAGARSKSKDKDGRAVYDKVSDGWADLEDLLLKVIRQHPALTFKTLFAGERTAGGKVIPGGYAGYAPSSDPRGKNDSILYANYVAGNLHLSADAPLLPLVDSARGPTLPV